MPTNDQLLDVRSDIPQRRHELIVEAFAALAPAGRVRIGRTGNPS